MVMEVFVLPRMATNNFFQLAVCQYDKKFGISREQLSDTHLGNATMKFRL
jgi:hypothetical protein